jgi:hypothetical protein
VLVLFAIFVVLDTLIARNKIGDEGLQAIAAALHGSSLEELSLQQNEFSDEGAKAFIAALPGSSLTELNLISGDGVSAVTAKALIDTWQAMGRDENNLILY